MGDAWRSRMDAARRACVRLALQGRVVLEQNKGTLDARQWDAGGRKGIVRVRLARAAAKRKPKRE